MRRGFGLIGLVVAAVLLMIAGVIAYSVGWSDGVSTQLPAGVAPEPTYYYGYGPHAFGWGFGLFWGVTPTQPRMVAVACSRASQASR